MEGVCVLELLHRDCYERGTHKGEAYKGKSKALGFRVWSFSASRSKKTDSQRLYFWVPKLPLVLSSHSKISRQED
jgi:hypothetical protein